MLDSISAAEAKFAASMVDADNLVAIHRHLNTGPGRRTREIALNRAIVVLSVAAWQALVQDLAEAGLATLSPQAGAPREEFNLLKATVKKAVYDFATPNAENTRGLLMRIGFDPWPSWRWQAGPMSLTPATARVRLNEWLQVRHAIAHGHAEWPDVTVLSSLAGGTRSLRLQDCENGMRFLRRLSAVTAAALDADLAAP